VVITYPWELINRFNQLSYVVERARREQRPFGIDGASRERANVEVRLIAESDLLAILHAHHGG
jgi:hypothetical protein